MDHDQSVTQDKKEKEITIIVNSRPKQWTDRDISFLEVVSLAHNGSPPTGPNWVFTVTYRKKEDKKERSMVEGDSVRAKDGMIFNVTSTDKS